MDIKDNSNVDIAIRYQKKRSIFDKTCYNPEWIPRVRPFSKHRKPGLTEWTDPNIILPNQIPPLHRDMGPQKFIKNVIQKEEMEKAKCKKQFILDDIRAGDIVEITYQSTFQSESTVTYRAFVLSFKRKKSLTATLEVVIRLGGMNIRAMYLVHSPKVKNIVLISKSSGNLRSNLKHNWRRMNKSQVSNAIVRNRVMKIREGIKRKTKTKKHSAMVFSQVSMDTAKRIIQ